MANWRVRPARTSDREPLAAMRTLLWPESSHAEHLQEVDDLLAGRAPGTLPYITLVAVDERDELTGFVEAGLRSRAEGCDVAKPVGYVEGWFVREGFRKRGVGRELIRAAEDWARTQGCVEMASDALIDNDVSHRAHEALGFEIVERNVHFRKRL
jgi:aminoglycoside 6'-N-acetyltransferase I